MYHGRIGYSRARTRKFESLESRLMLTSAPTVVGVEVGSSSWSTPFVDFLNDQSMGHYGYAIPTGSNQAQTVPWNNLDRIYITFSEDVEVDRSDLSLTGVNQSQYAFSDFVYDPQLRTARWTLTQPIGKDRLLIDLDATGADSVRNLDSDVLDGEWSNSSDTFPSGNGTVGGDFEFRINMLPGDVDRNSAVSYYDYAYTYYASGKSTTTSGYSPFYDIDGSGLISSADYSAVYALLGNTLPSGSPAGASNDAPTTTSSSHLEIMNAAIDVAFSLYDNFADQETADSSLLFSVVSNSASSLFDSVTINSLTGNLVLNTATSVSGRAYITLRATDAGGLHVDHVLGVDVARNNIAPVIEELEAEPLGDDWWRVTCFVSDPDGVVGGYYVLFTGVITARARVYPDGWVEFYIQLPPGTHGKYMATVTDDFGLDGVDMDVASTS